MKKIIEKAIENLGEVCCINGKKGYAVIMPVRYSYKTDGGVESLPDGRGDPEKYFIYCNAESARDIHYGNIVSGSENAYYVLWSDEVKSRYGDYVKICARKIKRGDGYI